jgi:hypothetical protein
MELEELLASERIECKHYMFVDAHFTWWVKGRSYLCRIIDMLHMGYVDEVLFGAEVIERVPSLASELAALLKAREAAAGQSKAQIPARTFASGLSARFVSVLHLLHLS